MPDGPPIFISAVSSELKTARDAVDKTLRKMGHTPLYQSIFPTLAGALAAELREMIQSSAAVIQIVGHRFGAELPRNEWPSQRLSYTQYEALFAREKGKAVFYLVLDPSFSTDPCDPEDEPLQIMQKAYRYGFASDPHVRYGICNTAELQLAVHEMRDLLESLAPPPGTDPAERPVTRAEMLAILRDFAPARRDAVQSAAGEDETVILGRAYAALEKKHGLPAGVLAIKFPDLVAKIAQSPDTSLLDRARAFFAEKKYAEAEAAALRAKADALAGPGFSARDALVALRLAGDSACAQIHYAQAIAHYRAATVFTDPERDAVEWACTAHGLAYVLDDHGQYAEAEELLRTAVAVRERELGPEHPATLASRSNLASVISSQGKYAEAEKENRARIVIEERVLGAEHPDVLGSRNNLANALWNQGKHVDAEREHRAVLAIRERVLGAEHPDTLTSRNNLANALNDQGKHSAAEREYREVLVIREHVLGAEHPKTLSSRDNLAASLFDQGKHAEAEREQRAVLALRERVLGAEHPDVFESCYNLAQCLKVQQKLAEALGFMQRAETGWAKVLAPAHPYSEDARQARERIEAALAAEKAKANEGKKDLH